MISIVVPTLNRAYTLRRTLPAMFEQLAVDEVILVSDAGTDDTEAVFADVAARYPHIRPVLLRNDRRSGAAFSRNRGAEAARGQYVLFCDDDVILGPDYVAGCLKRLASANVGAVSGRIVYMLGDEAPATALNRFKRSLHRSRPFNYALCELVNAARLSADAIVPFTHGIFMTRASLLRQYGFDPYYRQGNGYREESDYQMNLTCHGYQVSLTADTFCYHLARDSVKTGGQRRPKLESLMSTLRHNRYFYDKYYDAYRRRFGLRTPRWLAGLLFGAFALHRTYVEEHAIRVARGLMPRLAALTRPRPRVQPGASALTRDTRMSDPPG